MAEVSEHFGIVLFWDLKHSGYYSCPIDHSACFDNSSLRHNTRLNEMLKQPFSPSATVELKETSVVPFERTQMQQLPHCHNSHYCSFIICFFSVVLPRFM